MDIEFLGANCFRVKTKNSLIIIDDNLAKLGSKSPQTDKSVALYSNPVVQADAKITSRLVVDTPGEFEIGDVTVTGVQARGHMDDEGVESATVYQLMYDNQTVTFLGHVHPEISAEVMELIGGTDVLVVPVGGNGYTLDATGAASIVKKVEPGIVIPSHFEMSGINYEMPMQPLAEFLKIMPTNEEGEKDSFKLSKSEGDAASQTKVVVLSPAK